MTYVVTGAKGQLGRALVKYLSLNDIDHVALDSKQLDITNADQVYKVISTLKPRVIINAAAWTDVDGAEINKDVAFEVNGKGVENLAIAAKKSKSILTHISTDYVFSGAFDQPLNENSELKPESIYGLSKAAGELAIKKVYPEGSYIVRTAWLYSEYGKNFAKTMCRLALSSNEKVQVVSDQIGQPSNANDLAAQLVKLMDSKAKFGIYHGTNLGHASWYQFAQEIFRLAGADVNRVVPISSKEYLSLAKRPTYSVLAQDAWRDISISPMQDWRVALQNSMPEILRSVDVKQ